MSIKIYLYVNKTESLHITMYEMTEVGRAKSADLYNFENDWILK